MLRNPGSLKLIWQTLPRIFLSCGLLRLSGLAWYVFSFTVEDTRSSSLRGWRLPHVIGWCVVIVLSARLHRLPPSEFPAPERIQGQRPSLDDDASPRSYVPPGLHSIVLYFFREIHGPLGGRPPVGLYTVVARIGRLGVSEDHEKCIARGIK